MNDEGAVGPGGRDPGFSLLDVGAFLAELALLAALVATALRVPAALPLRVLLAVALPVVLAVVWGRWLSPRAPHRLVRRERVALKVALALAVAVALALVVAALAGVALGVLAVALLAGGELAGPA